MSIQRIEGSGFAQVANEALRDNRLSYRARGILAMVLSYQDGWEAPRDWLTKMSMREGKAAVQTALNELNEAGYRKVVKVQGPDGQWRTETHWFQSPAAQKPGGR